jgi:hypothetical protein
MSRIVSCLGGLLSAYAAYLILSSNSRARRKIPAQRAAALLRAAWADHHTTA